MLINDWASLAAICLLGAFSPGPSLMVILALTTSEGRRVGYIASIGHGFGIFIYALLSASGLALVVTNYENLFVFIQILGVFFLFYLGVRIIRASFSTEMGNKSLVMPSTNFSSRFLDGFLIAILNPKIGAFFISLFSQFLEIGQAFMTHLGMATLACIIDTCAYITMVSLVSTSLMRKFLSKYKKSVEFSFGFILLILSVSIATKITIVYV